jgi:hypothetical protein
MKRFKIIQIYIIHADDAASALEKFSQATNPTALLDGQFVKEAQDEGWKAAVKKQL